MTDSDGTVPTLASIPDSTNGEPASDPSGPRPGPMGRINPDPGPAFHAAFASTVKKSINGAVGHAYDIVREKHDETLGFNAQTFGHSVYHVGKFQLEQCCKRSGGGLAQVEELRTLFRFQGGDYTLGFYKVGNTADENIWESFPTSENGAMSINDEGQPFLVGLEDAVMDRVEDLRYVVVAHLGNPTDGLCALYLCIPIATERGKIIRWGYAEPLYVASRSVGAPGPAPTSPPREEFVPPVNAPVEEGEAEVVVTSKRRP